MNFLYKYTIMRRRTETWNKKGNVNERKWKDKKESKHKNKKPEQNNWKPAKTVKKLEAKNHRRKTKQNPQKQGKQQRTKSVRGPAQVATCFSEGSSFWRLRASNRICQDRYHQGYMPPVQIPNKICLRPKSSGLA